MKNFPSLHSTAVFLLPVDGKQSEYCTCSWTSHNVSISDLFGEDYRLTDQEIYQTTIIPNKTIQYNKPAPN